MKPKLSKAYCIVTARCHKASAPALFQNVLYAGLSVRADGGGIPLPVGIWCAGCDGRMKVGIKCFRTKVK